MTDTTTSSRTPAPRVMECGGQPDVLMAAFDALLPGESLVVLSKHVPKRLLGLLQENRKGLFEWSPLEAGPQAWRTELTRRQAAPGDTRAVNEALSLDHDRLEAIEQRAFEARAAGRYDEARIAFGEFDFGLRRHIRFEEEILFPVFEEWTHSPREGGPTGVMRSEHREIEALLEGLRGVIELPGPAADSLRAQLAQVLGGHNLKEENVIYPGVDRLLSASENDALVARIQAS